MIHTIYDHGGDDPATGLSAGQISGALRDAAGTLWMDLEAPTQAERSSVLLQALALESALIAPPTADETSSLIMRPRVLRLTTVVPAAASGGRAGTPGAGTLPLRVYLGSNVVTTEHAGVEFVAALRSASAVGLAFGASGLAARVVTGCADAWVGRIATLTADLAAIEDDVLGGAGASTASGLYGIRREVESIRHELPQMAADCRALSTEGVALVSPAVSPIFASAAALLERQAQAAERLAVRCDMAAGAQMAELVARGSGVLRWGIVATLGAAAAIVAAVLAAAR